MTYLAYENLETGRHTLVKTNINLKDYVLWVKSQNIKYSTQEWVSELINRMEEKNGKMDSDTQTLLLTVMIRNYIDSGLEFGNEDFYWFRTNGNRFHTVGRKLWKGATMEKVKNYFVKLLQKDYEEVYQTW